MLKSPPRLRDEAQHGFSTSVCLMNTPGKKAFSSPNSLITFEQNPCGGGSIGMVNKAYMLSDTRNIVRRHKCMDQGKGALHIGIINACNLVITTQLD